MNNDIIGHSELEKQVIALIDPAMENLGYQVVRVSLFGQDNRRTLQIFIDRPGGGINVDNCAEASRHISTVLDVSDLMSGRYHLEVSSPGIERPLTRLNDFKTFAGKEASVKLNEKIQEQKRFRGVILGVNDVDHIMLKTNIASITGGDEESTITFPLSQIDKANLISNIKI